MKNIKIQTLAKLWSAVLLAGLLSACSTSPLPPPDKPVPPRTKAPMPKPYKVLGEWYQPLPSAESYKERGLASWYGRDFHGRRTSNGETYNMFAMTAAHKTLPLGTFVRIQNLDNDKTIVVRVNDRGPFVRGRIIDLSYTAARELDVVGPGTARVEVVALETPDLSGTPSKPSLNHPDLYMTGNFSIQVGSFSTRQNALTLKSRMDDLNQDVRIMEYNDGERTFYRVWVGRLKTMDQAKKSEAALIQKGYDNAFVVAE
ncbi:MAG: septal ring lytic transglycosylase RlpA family protein [Desulfobacteraceae bacterium]|nr:septal ring lytic transglycosylase RlpA family protein [Desulfobacteraceae bacterium]